VAALDTAQRLDLLRTALAVVAGLWVLFLYRKRRQGMAVLRSALCCRVGTGPSGEDALFVRVHLTNISAVVVREVEATLTLFAPSLLGDGRVRFTGIVANNPLLPAADVVGAASGRAAFASRPRPDIEPAECIESEMLMSLDERTERLLALRLLVRGTESAVWRRRRYRWATFAFVDLACVGRAYTPITGHAPDAHEVHFRT
jgi:hypothetical protein